MSRGRIFRSILVAGILGISGLWSTGASAEGESVVLVATAKAGDRGPIDGLIDGLDQVNKAFGVETRFIESLDPAAYENQLRAIAQRGADVILTTFFAMGPAVAAVAPDFPDTKFVVIVGAPLDPPMPNVRAVGYATQDNAYLMGIFGAHMSKSGKLGQIGGVPLPTTWVDHNAMLTAAKTINPNVEITVAFVQSFQDPVKGKEVAAGLYAQGIDTIYTGASASDIGVVEAADEAGQLVMVASPPLVEQAPDNVGFVASFEWARTVMIEVENALSDEYQPGYRDGGIKTGEIVASFSDTYVDNTPGAKEAKEATLAAYNAILSGDLQVPFDLTEPSK